MMSRLTGVPKFFCFFQAAAEKKEAYLKDMEAFKKAGGVVEKVVRRSKKAKATRDPDLPKKPMSAQLGVQKGNMHRFYCFTTVLPILSHVWGRMW